MIIQNIKIKTILLTAVLALLTVGGASATIPYGTLLKHVDQFPLVPVTLNNDTVINQMAWGDSYGEGLHPEYLIDENVNTHWDSNWHTDEKVEKPGNPYDYYGGRHYIEVNKFRDIYGSVTRGDAGDILLISMKTRVDFSFGAPKRMEIYYHNPDNGTWNLAGTINMTFKEGKADNDWCFSDCLTMPGNYDALRLVNNSIYPYGVLPKYDIITRSVEIVNGCKDKVFLENVKSACLDFSDNRYDLITFYGRHAMERNFQRIPVSHGSHVIGSRRGTSSHQYNPLMILADHQTTEDFGDCYAMSFVYSGSFRGEVEQDQYEQTRAVLGLACELFSYPLERGEHFYAPEVVMTYSHSGLGQLSRNLHSCYRTHLCRGKFAGQVRPILINSWEASYFHFTGDSIYRLAKQAAELGIEMLVLDDGWFGSRSDDNRGLGDWYVNEEKMGGTLTSLVERINQLGLKFGIWIEPEMVNEDSELYRTHPDWAMQIPGRKPVRGRNQLLLDFSRKEVVDAIFEQICSVLDQANIEYIKWDMNRSMTDVYSVAATEQGRIQYDYVLGLYDFLERLIARYPNLLIEGCSGGGGRFDAGMLYYTPQIWCSDNTDALDRVRIQYGTSFGYPISAVGSHVSAVPNHQTGRITSLHTRGVVAMAGAFGYELNPELLSAEEKEQIRGQIADYHRYAPLIMNGQYYRLSNPFTDTIGAWEFVSEDGCEALINAVTLEVHGNMNVTYVHPKGLISGALYQDQDSKAIYPADALMHAGLPVPTEFGEYNAYQWHLKMMK